MLWQKNLVSHCYSRAVILLTRTLSRLSQGTRLSRCFGANFQRASLRDAMIDARSSRSARDRAPARKDRPAHRRAKAKRISKNSLYARRSRLRAPVRMLSRVCAPAQTLEVEVPRVAEEVPQLHEKAVGNVAQPKDGDVLTPTVGSGYARCIRRSLPIRATRAMTSSRSSLHERFSLIRKDDEGTTIAELSALAKF